jgi:DNA-binding response OmpR family regulator
MMKVLIVEDERTLSMIIADTLRDEGFEVVQAYDGNQGLSCLRVHHPDVVIADVMMPNMDGFEMVRQIRKTDKTTPVLFLTARSSTDDLVAGFKLGANDYLKKPFKMQELIIRVKALAGKAMQEEEASVDKIYEIGGFLFNPHRSDAQPQRYPTGVILHGERNFETSLHEHRQHRRDRQHPQRTVARQQSVQPQQSARVHPQAAAYPLRRPECEDSQCEGRGI